MVKYENTNQCINEWKWIYLRKTCHYFTLDHGTCEFHPTLAWSNATNSCHFMFFSQSHPWLCTHYTTHIYDIDRSSSHWRWLPWEGVESALAVTQLFQIFPLFPPQLNICIFFNVIKLWEKHKFTLKLKMRDNRIVDIWHYDLLKFLKKDNIE